MWQRKDICDKSLVKKHNNTTICWRDFRSARNRVVHWIRDAKRTSYSNSINANLDNPTNLCKIIRNIAPSKSSNLPNHLTIDWQTFTDPKDIANLFNHHFGNITDPVKLNDSPSNPNWDYLANFGSSQPSPNTTYTIPQFQRILY